MGQALRIVFMGTPEFSVAALKALAEAGHDIVAVYSQPPRPAGRGQREQPSPVQAFAESRGFPVRHPKSLKSAEEQASFAALKADVAVVAAYGLILPKAILDAPRLGCVNIHASLLPRWRGAAPIQRAILAGDSETGVTIMQMDEGLDTGAMVMMERLPITHSTNAAGLHDALAEMGARMINPALQAIASGQARFQPQPGDGVTYAAKLDKAEGRLDWSQPAAVLDRKIRALTPWPGVWFEHQGARIKVSAAELAAETGAPKSVAPGTVLDESLTVATSDGALRITRLQRPGKGPMAVNDFLRGYPLPAGTVLG